MHLEEFAEGGTLLHRLDPRVKFVSASPLIVITALLGGTGGSLLALVLGAGLAWLARLDPGKLGVRLAAVNVFVLLMWAFLPFGYPGEAAFSLGPLTATREGLLYTLGITLKTNAIVLITIAVFGTSEVFALAHALVHLRAPRKLVHLFFFFYRYISVLHEEYTRLRHAMAVRGFRATTSVHTYRSLAYLVGMLLVQSHERAGRIHQAMLCRGFDGRFPLVHHFELGDDDVIFGALLGWAAVILALIQWGGPLACHLGG